MSDHLWSHNVQSTSLAKGDNFLQKCLACFLEFSPRKFIFIDTI